VRGHEPADGRPERRAQELGALHAADRHRHLVPRRRHAGHAIAIGREAGEELPGGRARRRAGGPVTHQAIAAMITVKPASERISIILRPKRSARRPKSGCEAPRRRG
jgi:hypothetical protein